MRKFVGEKKKTVIACWKGFYLYGNNVWRYPFMKVWEKYLLKTKATYPHSGSHRMGGIELFAWSRGWEALS